MSTIRVVGFDPSLRHWGLATGYYDLKAKKLTLDHVHVLEPTITKSKQVRANSKDLSAAEQLAKNVFSVVGGAQAVFVEVPHGSQSARAMASFGICIGILGSLRAKGIQFYELSESEVKLATTGKKTSSKKEMIDWVTSRHPEANWSPHARVEHQADAAAAIYAGLQHPQFLQTLQFKLF